ncbi:hypothetical protein RHSIM_Rhsim10G0060700 [Rhododendron simsii]|uniref:Uncharacterized protein n=1 Tax=Rhododendron simsii TaxID=118357 RepID=A0A834GHG8_RHOSS|nr:hypothetical protein RHSIM_Rhsim10G0060700 [Rhododendron simsii]
MKKPKLRRLRRRSQSYRLLASLGFQNLAGRHRAAAQPDLDARRGGGAGVEFRNRDHGGRRECEVAQDVAGVQPRGLEQAKDPDRVARIRQPRRRDIKGVRRRGLREMSEEEFPTDGAVAARFRKLR